MADGAEFDFYPCLVDDAPASIYVDLRFASEPPPPDHGTRYTVAIEIRERGEHGIGTAGEAASLGLVEGAVIERAGELAITYVGRVRTRGVWEMVLYGAEGRLEPLRRIAIERAGQRRVDARTAPDPAWTYYRELLVPDAERRQWMDDRRMVQILSEQGDRLAVPRRVDHHLAFATTAARDAFVAEVQRAGFVAESVEGVRARVQRFDPIELDHIHDVVMTLVDAAAPHGGRYERWEAGIETA